MWSTPFPCFFFSLGPPIWRVILHELQPWVIKWWVTKSWKFKIMQQDLEFSTFYRQDLATQALTADLPLWSVKAIGRFTCSLFLKASLVTCPSFHMKISFHSHARLNSLSHKWLCTKRRYDREALGNSEKGYILGYICMNHFQPWEHIVHMQACTS